MMISLHKRDEHEDLNDDLWALLAGMEGWAEEIREGLRLSMANVTEMVS